jgi:hypothetical protein
VSLRNTGKGERWAELLLAQPAHLEVTTAERVKCRFNQVLGRINADEGRHQSPVCAWFSAFLDPELPDQFFSSARRFNLLSCD